MANEPGRRNNGNDQLEAAGAPHFFEPGLTTRRIMLDVVIGLVPVAAAAIWFFRLAAVLQMATCLTAALAAEAVICRLRGWQLTLRDGSVTITALLLAFSLPPGLPLYATVLGAFVAVALGKMAFGGLGDNIFNPAMVGRAFLMACFPAAMTTWSAPFTVHATTQATPLAAWKFAHASTPLAPLVVGDVPGSLGETSAIFVVIGGTWLLVRRAADWRLVVGMLAGAALMAVGQQLIVENSDRWSWLRQVCAGGMLLGAFFIVTDPVTSPLSKSGRWLFGLGVGVLTMTIRWFAGYPEGVMFAVLVGNAFTPLINRWTAPVPLGGKCP